MFEIFIIYRFCYKTIDILFNGLLFWRVYLMVVNQPEKHVDENFLLGVQLLDVIVQSFFGQEQIGHHRS